MTPVASGQAGGSALEFARAAYREISLYAPDRRPVSLDLSDNTSLFGVPPAALAALRAAAESTVTRYPAVYAGDLKTALARYVGAEPSEIVTGCGSDDVLDSAMRAFTEPGDLVAYPDPSFAMIPLFARMNGLQPVGVPLQPDLDIDADALVATNARIIYLCTPNNPTGVPHSATAIARVVERASGVVIIDEAYAEFADDTTRWRGRGPRVLSVRTLSKAFGLAGLRIGYAVGPREMVREVEKSRGPYKVNAIAERAAVAALTEDAEWVRARIEDIRASRARMTTELRTLGLAPIPSASNFILVPVVDAASVAAGMRERGVAIRPFPGLRGIGDAIRISLGPWEMMETALTALRAALE